MQIGEKSGAVSLPREESNVLEGELSALRVRLMRQARLLVADHGTAEDLVQDTLLTVYEKQHHRRGDASLTTWAIAILKNRIADWYRAPGRRRMVSLHDDSADGEDPLDALFNERGEFAQPVHAWQTPEGETEQHQLAAVLNRCVSRLTTQSGQAFVMREWLGFETPEICQQLGITPDNCRTILHRARLGLRDCLQTNWFGRIHR